MSAPDHSIFSNNGMIYLGINLQWTFMPWDEWREQRLRRRETHLVVDGWSADYPDPHNFLNVAVHLLCTVVAQR